MIRRVAALALLILALTGCDTGVRYIGPTEYGVRFRRLPPAVGGGVSHSIIPPGQMAVIWPWDALYRLDTSVKYVKWGESESAGSADDLSNPEMVYTRARDGNEVALGVTVNYSITSDAQQLARLVQEVGTNESDFRSLVIEVGRADIRTHMNHLTTEQFANEKLRNAAVDEVKRSMAGRLAPFGINVQLVKLDRFQFERLLKDGAVDSSYQDRINSLQTLVQKTEREVMVQQTIKAEKEQELMAAQIKTTTMLEEAKGFEEQAKLRGTAYLEVKRNQAEGILAAGRAEAKGLAEQVAALAGPGGQAMLKLDLARELKENSGKFVAVGSAGKDGVAVSKLDTNDLLRQIGVIEGLKDKDGDSSTAASTAPSSASASSATAKGAASSSSKTPSKIGNGAK